MSFNLAVFDWNAISALSTLLAVIVALFYQPFMNRRKVGLETGLSTEDGIHFIRLKIINRGEKPIWIVASGMLYEDDEKRWLGFWVMISFRKDWSRLRSFAVLRRLWSTTFQSEIFMRKTQWGSFGI